MSADCTESPQYAPFLNQGRDFNGERRKCGQSTQKTGDDKQPPLGRQDGMMGKNGNSNTNQVAADQICRQRAEWNGWK